MTTKKTGSPAKRGRPRKNHGISAEDNSPLILYQGLQSRLLKALDDLERVVSNNDLQALSSRLLQKVESSPDGKIRLEFLDHYKALADLSKVLLLVQEQLERGLTNYENLNVDAKDALTSGTQYPGLISATQQHIAELAELHSQISNTKDQRITK